MLMFAVWHFWMTVSKTVHPMISDRCLSCPVCSVCDVGVLWPNGSTDQDETRHVGRPRPWPHCVRWQPRSSSPRGHNPQFSTNICCGQTSRWIKMPLGRKLGLDPSDTVLDGDPASPRPKKAAEPLSFAPYLLCPNGWMDEDAT